MLKKLHSNLNLVAKDKRLILERSRTRLNQSLSSAKTTRAPCNYFSILDKLHVFLPESHLRYRLIALLHPITQYKSSSWSVLFCQIGKNCLLKLSHYFFYWYFAKKIVPLLPHTDFSANQRSLVSRYTKPRPVADSPAHSEQDSNFTI